MSENSASGSILKVIASATDHVHVYPSVDRYKRNTSASSKTIGWATRKMLSIGSAIAVAEVITHIQTGGIEISRTEAVEAEKDMEDTGETGTSRVRVRAEMTYSSEETGLVV